MTRVPDGRRGRRGDAALSREIGAAAASAYARILAVVATIPRGRVMTYGEVAAAAGLGRGARLVGWAMASVGKRVPWQRVVGKRRAGVGQITIKDPVGGATQRMRLEAEGVEFSSSGGIDLEVFGWTPPKRPARRGGRGR
jgi:methylated-DNA-protein-cysteine methyltransferase-like protein